MVFVLGLTACRRLHFPDPAFGSGRPPQSFPTRRSSDLATLALVFAMSGGALAAKHYLITSTKQISPKVLKKLKGKTGKSGATGPAGLAGAAGKEGAVGKNGANGERGPSNALGVKVGFVNFPSNIF